MRAANPPSVSQTPTETRVSSLSEQRRQRGGGQAAGSSFSPAASPGQVEACRLWGWSEGVGLRGLGERQALTTCRVPSLRLRGPVALGWEVSGRATGHDPQQEQALFAGAGGWEPGCMHIPRTPRITHTHASTRVLTPAVSHTGHIQGTIMQPHELTAVQFKTALGPHLPPHAQAAPRNGTLGPHGGHLTPALHQNPATQSPEQAPAPARSHSTQ